MTCCGDVVPCELGVIRGYGGLSDWLDLVWGTGLLGG